MFKFVGKMTGFVMRAEKEYKRKDSVEGLMLILRMDDESLTCYLRGFVVLGYDIDRVAGGSRFL